MWPMLDKTYLLDVCDMIYRKNDPEHFKLSDLMEALYIIV